MSVQELLATHDCAVPGCPSEARERGGLCSHHATTSVRPRPAEPGSHAHLMKEPTVNDCKIDGCTNPSAGKGGWCVGLCQEHISEGMRQRQATVARRKAAPQPRSQPKPKPSPRSSAAAQVAAQAEAEPTLVQLATECETAAEDLTAARLRHETAVAALRAALDAAA